MDGCHGRELLPFEWRRLNGEARPFNMAQPRRRCGASALTRIISRMSLPPLRGKARMGVRAKERIRPPTSRPRRAEQVPSVLCLDATLERDAAPHLPACLRAPQRSHPRKPGPLLHVSAHLPRKGGGDSTDQDFFAGITFTAISSSFFVRMTGPESQARDSDSASSSWYSRSCCPYKAWSRHACYDCRSRNSKEKP